jgi:mRNA interferase MazF
MSTTRPTPRRGEVWRVDLNPTRGAEMQKTRPVIVLSSDATGRLPIKLVAPITSWDEGFSNFIWHVRIEPDRQNGLTRPSSVDVLQTRGVDVARFIDRMGRADSAVLDEILAALVAVVEYE